MKSHHSSLSASPGLKCVSAMRQSFTVTLLFSLMLAASLFCGGMAWAEENYVPPPPNVYITPTVGPPTTTVFVSGNGFDPFAAVDIYFDTTDLAIVRTDINGAFGTTSPTPKPTIGGVPIIAPKDALPGTHWITAVERDQNKSGQVQFLVRTDWAQFRFSPDLKGVNPYENILNPDNVGGLGLRWSSPTGNAGAGSATVANGIVYQGTSDGDDGYVRAFDASTRTLLWKFKTNGWVDDAPAVVNGVVYFGDRYGPNLYALNAGSGALIWKYTTSAEVDSSPAVINGAVYFGNLNGDVYALDSSTGALCWQQHKGQCVGNAVAVANAVVYANVIDDSSAEYLYALNSSTGAELWKAQIASTGAQCYSYSSPAVVSGVVYVGSWDHNVYALNAKTGVLWWKYTTGDQVHSSPAIADGVVYVGSYDSNLYALNADTGTLVWKYTTGSDVLSSPAVVNGVAYFGSDDGNLYALNAGTGALLWKYPLEPYLWSSPTVANGIMYFASTDINYNSNLYAFDLSGSLSPDKLNPPERPDPSSLLPDWELQPSAVVTRNPSDLN